MPVVTEAEMVRASGINPKANISKKSFYQSVKKGLCLVVTQPLGILFLARKCSCNFGLYPELHWRILSNNIISVRYVEIRQESLHRDNLKGVILS